jgi:cytoskeletal protein CcmA (bactofilin family)
MADVHVDKGSVARLGRVEGELTVGRGARITAADGGKVVVTGGAHFQGDAQLDCDFECDALVVDMGELKVAGDLTVAKGMDVAHSVKATGEVRAGEIAVGGKMVAGSVSCATRVGVGGLVDVAKTLEADVLDVAGKVEIGGRAKLKDLSVGGLARVGGGAISGNARVGGLFESSEPLQFGQLQVYGRCKLPAGCRGKKVSTWGKLDVDGDLECEDMDIGGVADIGGSCRSGKVRVNGKLDVRGSLSATESLDSLGSCVVEGDFSGGELHVGGRFKAAKALVEKAQIAGEVETVQGIKAQEVLVGSGSKVRGPIVGGRVELSVSKLPFADWNANWMGQVVSMRLVGRMTNAEDVYADEVVLGPGTRCRNIFAKIVELGKGSIATRVTYTQELRQGHNLVHLEKPSDKVETLPRFPL